MLKSSSCEDEPEVLSVVAKGIADVLSAACPISTATEAERASYGDTTRYLDSQTLTTLWQMVIGKMEICIKRREELLLKGADWGVQDDEVEGEAASLESNDEHHDANISLSQIIGALMQLNGQFFKENFMGEIGQMISFLLDSSKINAQILPKDKKVIINKNKILSYFIACDLCEYLK